MTDDRKETLDNLKRAIRQDVRDEADYLRNESYPEDAIHEMADGWVPVYNSDLADVLASDLRLGYFEPEVMDGADNVWTMLQRVIYDELYAVAIEEWEAIKEEDGEDEDA